MKNATMYTFLFGNQNPETLYKHVQETGMSCVPRGQFTHKNKTKLIVPQIT